ncbi:M13 family metallopeptidase [Eisenibacter elegans]|uniref:M13 family metallopeptidase n=1 Tax=Eisenibacter elegans TaxID=997 RepID=UPI0003FF7750|nr:M13 family metallopeptidase [Eisenibacter elegans]
MNYTTPRMWLWAVLLLAPMGLLAQALDLKDMDKTVRAQDDFYRFVNGGWLDRTEIPASEGRWGSFNEVNDRNLEILKKILEKAQKDKKSAKGSDIQLVGAMYASGMDMERRNALGATPIKPELDQLASLQSPNQVAPMWAYFQKTGIGGVPFFFYITIDAKDSKVNAAHLSQAGLSLPSRDYYLEDNFADVRKDYVAHIAKMFVLATGISQEQAEAQANTVLKMETRLATFQRTPVQNRVPTKRYNKMTIAELEQITFNINWKEYFAEMGLNSEDIPYIIVGQPEFISMVDRMISDFKPAEWRALLTWKLISGSSAYLSEELEKTSFEFFSTRLRGISEMQERWKIMQGMVNRAVGQPLGKLYVAEAFPPAAKVRMEEMIENIREALRERIKNLDWMGEATKEEALKKLNAINYKIGYPDVWRDYSKLDLRADDFLGNLRRVSAFEFAETISKLGQPVDPNEWGMTPPTVNAYYSPTRNEIVFPAGILQPPFFDFKADDALNYGAIGAVIGHEIIHGFDDQGSQFDADGNLRMWWTPEDRQKFEERTRKMVEQFNAYTVLDSVHVNGQLTLGENIADLGGLTLAYDALQRSFAKNGRPADKDGFTPEQRLFIGFARVWRSKYRPQVRLEQIKTDPHSPGEFRTIGPMSNMPYFYKAFDVKEGDPMYRPENVRVVIW